MAGRSKKNEAPAVEETKKEAPVAEAPAAETKTEAKEAKAPRETVSFTVRQNQLSTNDKLPGKAILSIRLDDKYYSTVINNPEKQVSDATKVRKGVAKADQEPMMYKDKDGNDLQYKQVILGKDVDFTNVNKATGEKTSLSAVEMKGELNARSAAKSKAAEATAENVKEAPAAEAEASK